MRRGRKRLHAGRSYTAENPVDGLMLVPLRVCVSMVEESGLVSSRPFQSEWDQAKAEANARKHGVVFESASTVFHEPAYRRRCGAQRSRGTLVFGWVRQQRRGAVGRLPWIGRRSRSDQNPADFGSQSNAD